MDTKRIQLISLKHPCSACLILCNLSREMLQKLQKSHEYVVVEIIMLDHVNQAYLIEGLEVDKFPAIIIDGEQILAGSLPHAKVLEPYISDRRCPDNE